MNLEQAKANGLKVRHDHAERSDAIPLPATLTNDLGELIAKDNSGVEVRLYRNAMPSRMNSEPTSPITMYLKEASSSSCSMPNATRA